MINHILVNHIPTGFSIEQGVETIVRRISNGKRLDLPQLKYQPNSATFKRDFMDAVPRMGK